MDTRLNNDCLGLGAHITLNVEPILIVKPIIATHCDDNQTVYMHLISAIDTNLLNGLTNVTVTYLDQNINPLSSPLPNPFVTGSWVLKVHIQQRPSLLIQPYNLSRFNLQEAFPVATTLTTICDDETDPSVQDRKFAFDTSTYKIRF